MSDPYRGTIDYLAMLVESTSPDERQEAIRSELRDLLYYVAVEVHRQMDSLEGEKPSIDALVRKIASQPLLAALGPKDSQAGFKSVAA